ncbi:MAG: hypothetical protein KAR39_12770 [Thermoplasmata archaeon]|nr:hypothetical protein [Thermoplasmata archaeon]
MKEKRAKKEDVDALGGVEFIIYKSVLAGERTKADLKKCVRDIDCSHCKAVLEVLKG